MYASGANAALKYGALGSVAAASLLSGLDRRLQLAAPEESQRRLACYRRDPQAIDHDDINEDTGRGTAEASLALAWKVYTPGTRLDNHARRHKALYPIVVAALLFAAKPRCIRMISSAHLLTRFEGEAIVCCCDG